MYKCDIFISSSIKKQYYKTSDWTNKFRIVVIFFVHLRISVFTNKRMALLINKLFY